MLLRKIAENFFFFVDEFIQQKRIFLFLNNEKLKFNNLAIDVGAHLGNYTNQVLKLNIKAKVFLFEPQKKYYQKLVNNYKNNHKIKVFNYAISDKKKTLTLKINKHDLTTSLNRFKKTNSLFFFLKSFIFGENPKNMISSKINIKTKILSNILKKNKVRIIDLIKIDTEGHDFNVILGLGKYIDFSKYLIVEFHKKETFENYYPEKMHDYILQNGFILKKVFKFPFLNFEDRIYKNIKY
jgi:FkbM family methyltransferase